MLWDHVSKTFLQFQCLTLCEIFIFASQNWIYFMFMRESPNKICFSHFDSVFQGWPPKTDCKILCLFLFFIGKWGYQQCFCVVHFVEGCIICSMGKIKMTCTNNNNKCLFSMGQEIPISVFGPQSALAFGLLFVFTLECFCFSLIGEHS